MPTTHSPYSDSLSLRLPLLRVNLATDTNSLAHYAKGTQSGISLPGIALLPLVSTGFQILFHSPKRGSFHLSLTVLCAIGDMLYLALDDGPPGFPQGYSSPMVLGILLAVMRDVVDGAITLFGRPSQTF